MGKLFFAIVAVFASVALVESLSCNKCSFSQFGLCLGFQNLTCTVNGSVCYTGKTTFPSLTTFLGFNAQGCQDNSTGCDATNPGTLMGVTYQTQIACCTSNNCNPVTLSGAPSTKTTFTAAVGAAVLASVLGSVL